MSLQEASSPTNQSHVALRSDSVDAERAKAGAQIRSTWEMNANTHTGTGKVEQSEQRRWLAERVERDEEDVANESSKEDSKEKAPADTRRPRSGKGL